MVHHKCANPNIMKKLITSIVVALTVNQIQAQITPDQPKLVVGIVVDQLRGDYLTQFYTMFSEGGFKRLMREGAYYRDMKYDFPNPDEASATATLFTGANPWYHGIVGINRYNRETKKPVFTLIDPAYMGNYTDETVSPKNLLVNTLTDELKIATEGFGSVYSFAPNSDEAIVSGGHAADGAFWIDNRNRNWATSTYYQNLPSSFDAYNRKNPLSDRIESMVWEPLYDVSTYKYFPYKHKDFSFKYAFRNGKDNLAQFKSGALINEEVNRLVLHFFNNETLGKRTYPDFLSVTFHAGAFKNKAQNDNSLEIQDTYLRLDKQLELLLNTIDSKVGLKNALIFLASTGYYEENEYIPERLNVPDGDFYPNRATALLNMYLMSIYGQGDWVTGYFNKEIFLNRKLIDDKQLDLTQVQTKAAEFLIQMSGVQDVITSFSLLLGRANDDILQLRNGVHRKISGDLILELQPGWKESYEKQKDESSKVRKSAIQTPLFFFGNNIKAARINRVIKATEVAPTVSYYLRIRAPSACSDGVLKELF